MTAEAFYPDYLMPFARELEVKYRRFADLREQALLDLSFNTARAYWGDLEDICLWALERDKDVLDLSEGEIRQYLALLRRRQYSESTVRRRITALRRLYRRRGITAEATTVADEVVVRKRRTTVLPHK